MTELKSFTPRQVDVLRGIARGQSYKEIARSLGIGEESVKSHAAVVRARCHAANREQVAVWAVKRGIQ